MNSEVRMNPLASSGHELIYSFYRVLQNLRNHWRTIRKYGQAGLRRGYGGQGWGVHRESEGRGGLRAAEDPETQAAIIAASDPCVKLTVAAQERNTHLQYLGALRCSLHFPGMLVQVGDLQDEKEVA